MATASIPLAKGYDLSKMEWPAYLSVKHDGVPVKLTVTIKDGACEWHVESRSGEPVPSVHNYAHIIACAIRHLFSADGVFVIVAEITHQTLKDFKDVSGIVRKKTPQTGLIWNVFDYDGSYAEPTPFEGRTLDAQSLVHRLDLDWLRYVLQTTMRDEHMAAYQVDIMQRHQPEEEGFVLVSAARMFKPNSRHWDYQKIVVDPTVDLRIVGFEEAMSKDGTPKGMVGRIIADYKGIRIGVGPGKLNHAERTGLWQDRGVCLKINGNIATIKYKRDASYTALRQPTFQHWRPEKKVPSYD